METVAGQKIIKIKRVPKGEVYTYDNIEAEEAAAQALNAGAFKLWCYLRRNSDGYVFALSPVDCKERYGIGLKQYRGAVKELLEKGYLYLERGSVYTFYEMKSNAEE